MIHISDQKDECDRYVYQHFSLTARSLRSLDRRGPARFALLAWRAWRTQTFCLRDLRRQKHQSLRDTIIAFASKA